MMTDAGVRWERGVTPGECLNCWGLSVRVPEEPQGRLCVRQLRVLSWFWRMQVGLWHPSICACVCV